MKRLIILIEFFLIFIHTSYGQWACKYLTEDASLNGTGYNTASVAVFGEDNFVALVSPMKTNIPDTLTSCYLVGYRNAANQKGRLGNYAYAMKGFFMKWGAGADTVRMWNAWKIVAYPKMNLVLVANNDKDHSILTFELRHDTIVPAPYRMKTGSRKIWGIDVDDNGKVYVICDSTTSANQADVMIFESVENEVKWTTSHDAAPINTIDLPASLYKGIAVEGSGKFLFIADYKNKKVLEYIGSPISSYIARTSFFRLTEADSIPFANPKIYACPIGLSYIRPFNMLAVACDTFFRSNSGFSKGYSYGRIYFVDPTSGKLAGDVVGNTAVSVLDQAKWAFDKTGSYSSQDVNVSGYTSTYDVGYDQLGNIYSQSYYSWTVEKWNYFPGLPILTVTSVPTIGLSSSSIPFGSVTVGNNLSQNLTISNTGDADLIISNISISGADLSMFTYSGASIPTIISTGNNIILNIKFTPGSIGNKDATLQITHNASGSPTSVTLTGTGLASAPTVTTNPVTSVSSISATLNGSVNANGVGTTVTFEYGTTTSYGTTVNASPNTVTGTTNTDVAVSISSLQPNTTYHYRVKAVSSGGTSYGSDQTFTTNLFTQTAYWTENFEDMRFPGSPGPAVATDITDTNGVWILYAAYRTSSSTGVPVGTYDLRMPKPSSVSTGGFCFIVTPKLSDGVSKLSFYEGRGDRVIIIEKSTDDGKTWIFVDTVRTTAKVQNPCKINDSKVNRVRLSNQSTSDADIDEYSVYKFDVIQQPLINLSPNSISFGNVTVGASKNQNITISNTGTTDLTINDLSITGTDRSMFLNSGITIPATITEGDSVNLNMKFTPSSIGNKDATLQITHNASGSPTSVTLTGTGLASAPTVTTNPVTSVSSISATLNGSVNANGVGTTVTFEYGTTTSYGTTVNASPNTVTGTTNTDVAVSISSLQPNTTYHYRVKAVSIGGTSYGNDQTFTTILSIPNAPTLLTPADNAGSVSTSPILTWNSVTGASTYGLQVSTDYNFSTFIFAQGGLTNTSQALSGLQNGTIYYWRVNATNISGTSAWSSIRGFTTVLSIPNTPTLLTPADNAGSVSTSPILTWNSVTGASTYGLQVSTDYNFSTFIFAQGGLTNTSQALSGLQNGTIYYWRVNATNISGTSAWSSVRSFNTIVLPPSAITNNANDITTSNAKLFGIVNANGVGTTVTFEYGTTTSYGTTVNASPNTVTGTTNTDVAVSISSLQPNTTYHYRVKAVNNGGTSYGNDQSFTTLAMPKIALNLTNLTFNAYQNQSAAVPSQTFNITNSGGGTLSWSISSSQTWLIVNPTSGSGDATITVSINSTNLTPSTYLPEITINSSNASNNPQKVSITYKVDQQPKIVLSSSSLSFYAMQGQSVPSAQTFTITNGGGSTLNWNISSPQSWLVVNPSSGSSNNATINVSLTGTSLSPGVYNPNLSITATDAVSSPSTINVKYYIITPTLNLSKTYSFPDKAANEYTGKEYQLIGLPGNYNQPVTSLLKGTQDQDWKIFWDNGSSNTEITKYDGSDNFKYATGRAFILLCKGPWSVSTNNVSMPVPNSNQEIEIPLHSGWNLITNPYTSNIQWNTVQQYNGISVPIYSLNSDNSWSYSQSQVMEPFIGYYFDIKI